MTIEDVTKAYFNWRQLTNSPRNQNSMRAFMNFIEADIEVWNDVFQHKPLPEKTATRINWLAGPNAKVLYEVWKAQNGK